MNLYKVVKLIDVLSINNARAGLKPKHFSGERPVMRLEGAVRQIKVEYTREHGRVFRLIGEFRATNQEGEQFLAPVAYAPAGFGERVYDTKEKVGDIAIKVEFYAPYRDNIFYLPQDAEIRQLSYFQ
jgi:hypothetical protein